MTVAERIKKRRLELNLSQTELAKKAGYKDKTSISKLEHSENDITIKQIARLADSLNTTISYLMGWGDVAEEIGKNLSCDVSEVSRTENNSDNALRKYKNDNTFMLYIKKLWELPEESRQAMRDFPCQVHIHQTDDPGKNQ